VAVDRDRRHDDRARGQRLEAVLRTDRDRQSLVEDVLDERDDEELLLENGQHLAHRLHAVEGLGDLGRAADEHLLALERRGSACSVATASRTSVATWSVREGTWTLAPSTVPISSAFNWRDASATST